MASRAQGPPLRALGLGGRLPLRKEGKVGVMANRPILSSISLNTQRVAAPKDLLKPVKTLIPQKIKEQKEEPLRAQGTEAELEAAVDEVVDSAETKNDPLAMIGGSPQMVSEYVNEIYNYLRIVEEKQAIRKDHLAGASLNPKMRALLVDWLVGVNLQFHLLQETLYTTVAVMDRFLQVEAKSIPRSQLQLVGAASMLVASKYEEIYPPQVRDFVHMCDNAYDEKKIRKMEMRVLATLGFDLGRPLPLHFLRRASKVGNVDTTTHALAKYIVELALGVYSLSHEAPSRLAAAALALALRILDPDNDLVGVWSSALVHYTKYSVEDLSPLVPTLATALITAPENKLATVYTKYRNKKFSKISTIPELDNPVLKSIAMGELL
jgi:cyclin B